MLMLGVNGFIQLEFDDAVHIRLDLLNWANQCVKAYPIKALMGVESSVNYLLKMHKLHFFQLLTHKIFTCHTISET